MRTLEFTTARLVLALLLLSVGSGWGQTLQKTQIQDTLFNADGSKVEGTVMITWKSFTAVDGSTVVNSTVDVPIVQGLISVGLTPNEGAVPSGTSYRANYTLNNGRRFSETWIVPISGSPVTVSDVRVSLPPTIGQTISQGQVTGLVDALDKRRAWTNRTSSRDSRRFAKASRARRCLAYRKSAGAMASSSAFLC